MTALNSIFVSYRRSDSNDITGRIYDFLSDRFGRDSVFKDVDSIPLGADFHAELNQTIGSCHVLIAVIGPSWVKTLQDRADKELIDWVYEEIKTALVRDIPVIPILVGGAKIPLPSELPQELQKLSRRNPAQARPDPDFKPDMDRLIQQVEQVLSLQSSSEFTSSKQGEELKNRLQEKLELVASLLSELQKQLEKQRRLIPPEDGHRIFMLLKQIEKIAAQETSLENIKKEFISCSQAYAWLVSSIEEVAQSTADRMTSQKAFFDYLKMERQENFSKAEIRSRLASTLEEYLRWLGEYVRYGAYPDNDFKKNNLVNLDFSAEAYKEAFQFLISRYVHPSYSKLSIDAAEIVASYINLFLVDDVEEWNLLSY